MSSGRADKRVTFREYCELMENLSDNTLAARDAVWDVVRANVRKHATLLKFTLVGALGYALYTGTLFLTYDLPTPFMPARDTHIDLGLFTHSDFRLLIATIVAAEVSISGGFFPRDLWVFTDRALARKPGWLRFVQYQVKSVVSTLGVLTVTVNFLTPVLGVPHYIATPIGVAAAFAWNWFTESAIIWRRAQ